MRSFFPNPKSLADYIDMDSPEAVLHEVQIILGLIDPAMDSTRISDAFHLVVGLYRGHWPSEQACNTHFHDLRHMTDTVLAMARLIHGAILNGHSMDYRQILTGLVGAMAHDAGYIQDKGDGTGTGAKYTIIHVQRSMDFIERYGRQCGLGAEEIPVCRLLIQCTDLEADIASIHFPSATYALLGKILACADLIGQMADRIYLEKLFYLFREFEEGQVNGYRDEMDLLSKTKAFFPLVGERIKDQLGGVDEFAVAHFKSRWDIPENLYSAAIEKQKRHLARILALGDCGPCDYLRRKNIVRKISCQTDQEDG